MTIGKGIAIAGIWLSVAAAVGLSVFSGVTEAAYVARGVGAIGFIAAAYTTCKIARYS